MTKTLFKKLYRDYRIAQRVYNDTGDNALILTYMNSLGNTHRVMRILKDVQNCYIKARYSNEYHSESINYIFFKLTK